MPAALYVHVNTSRFTEGSVRHRVRQNIAEAERYASGWQMEIDEYRLTL